MKAFFKFLLCLVSISISSYTFAQDQLLSSVDARVTGFYHEGGGCGDDGAAGFFVNDNPEPDFNVWYGFNGGNWTSSANVNGQATRSCGFIGTNVPLGTFNNLCGSTLNIEFSTSEDDTPDPDDCTSGRTRRLDLPISNINFNQQLGTGTARFNTNNGPCQYRLVVEFTRTLNKNPYVSVSGDIDICAGESTTLTAGDLLTAPYSAVTYRWYSNENRGSLLGSGNSFNTGVLSSTTDYWVTADYGSCESYPVRVVVTVQPHSISFNSKTDVTCPAGSDGVISINVNGDAGSNNYFYRRLSAPSYPNWTAAGSTSGSGVLSYENLQSGDYELLMVTPNNNCHDSITSTITLNEPFGQIDSVPVINNVSCNGLSDGQFQVHYSGFTGTVEISLNGGATYGTSGSSSPITVSGVAAGSYNIVARFNGGACTFPYAGNPVVVTQPAALSITNFGTPSDPLCNGDSTGSITGITVTGGTPPYEYSIDAGSNYQLTNNNFINLTSGSYNVQIRDANGCIVAAGVPTVLTDPWVLYLSADSVDNACPGAFSGRIEIDSVSGGTPPYQFFYNGLIASLTPNLFFNGLGAGEYAVAVVDDNGCVAFDSTIIFNKDTLFASVDSIAPVSCNGGSDGYLSVIPDGGFPPYSYSYNGSPGTPDSFSNTLPAGAVFVDVTDNQGCQATVDTHLTQPLDIIIAIDTVGEVACKGDSTGFINITVSGGNGGYAYLWSNGATSQDITGVKKGTYFVTVTDSLGCVNSTSILVTEVPELGINVADSVNISCKGFDDGEIDITVTGGTPPYNFFWSDGENAEDNIDLTAGTYTVTASDLFGCTTTRSVSLSEPDSLQLTLDSITEASCNFTSDGAIYISVTGGTGPFTYLWNNFSGGQDLTNIPFGNYTVVVTDKRGCNVTANYTVNENSTLNVIGNVTDVSCFGANNGSVDLSVSGGGTPYSYKWSNGQTSEDIFGLAPNNYFVTVTDFANCNFISLFNITQPNPISYTVTEEKAICDSASGSLIVDVSGGTAPYNYLWSDSGATTSDTLSMVRSGIYTLTVTDFKGCKDSVELALNDSTDLNITVDTLIDVICFGNADGEIQLTTNLGVGPPYTYNWSNGGTTEDLTGLTIGTYNVTVLDGALCKVLGQFELEQPDSLVALAVSTPNNECFAASGPNGTVDLSVSGGVKSYTYAWSNGKFSEDIDSLIGGFYTVTITDANSCVQVLTDSVGQVDTMTINPTIDNLTCNSDTNGNIFLTVTGGVPNYSFVWSNGSTNQDQLNLSVGTYRVTVTDQSGCQAIRQYTIAAPAPLALSVSTVGATCNGGQDGSADLTVTGGTTPYSYFWSTTDTTQDIDSVISGIYSVTVTDSVGCTQTLVVIIDDNSTITIDDSVKNITCFGLNNGEIQLDLSGGTPAYITQWSNGSISEDLTGLNSGSYSLTVTDAALCRSFQVFNVNEPAPLITNGITSPASCNGGMDGQVALIITGGTVPYNVAWDSVSTGLGFIETNDTLFNVTAGTYIVTVTDDNGCQAINSFNVSEKSQINISPNISDVSCFGLLNGSIDLTVAGGTSPYAFAWSDGPFANEDRFGLGAGNYNVTVTDNNLCAKIQLIEVEQPDTLNVLALTTDNNTCSGSPTGSILLQLTGGTAPFNFNWSNAATTQSLFNISGGVYDVTITDDNGCIANYTDSISDIDSLALEINVDSITCFGRTDGNIQINVAGGTPPYNYNWSSGATSKDLINIGAGNYSLTVTDKFSCTASASNLVVFEPSALTRNTSSTDVSCNGGSDGTVDVSVTGGTWPYNFFWSNGSTDSAQTGLASGSYNILLIDDNGCIVNDATTVNQPAPISISGMITDVDCKNAATGEVDVTVSGGNGGNLFTWSNSATTEDINGLLANNYILTVTDSKACTGVDSFLVEQPDSALTATEDIDTVTCFGGNDGRIILTVSGGSFPYAYNWSNGKKIKDIDKLNAGTYTVTIADANGCIFINSYVVDQPASLLTVNLADNDLTCFESSDGSILTTVTGGTAPYTYNWTDGSSNADLTSASAGTYTVVITDDKGCVTSATATISQPAALNAFFNKTDIDCKYDSTGAIDMTPTGGNGGNVYTWSNGESTEDINTLDAGWYTLTITDALGCTLIDSVEIDQPDSSLVTIAVEIDSASCTGDADGVIELLTTGGTFPYAYSWSNGKMVNRIEKLAQGEYFVTVNDANGCSFIDSFNIYQPFPISATPVVVEEIQCNGLTNGKLSTQIIGGTPPFNHLWSNFQTTDTAVGLGAGSISVIITDGNGCTTSTSADLTEPPLLELRDSTVDVRCFGQDSGAVGVFVNGGTPGYTYLWNNGVTQSFQLNISAGFYSVTVLDQNGCSATVLSTVSQPTQLTTNVSASSPTCGGGSTGVASVFPTGGIAPYAVSWSTTPTQNGLQAINLNAGAYAVTVSDANGCSVLDTARVTQPDTITVSVDPGAVTCFGGSDAVVNVSADGGNPPYAYILNGARQTDASFESLNAGTYIAEVEDVNKCKGFVQFEIVQPEPVIIDLFVDQELPGPNSVVQGQEINLAANFSGAVANVGSVYWISNDDTINCPANPISNCESQLFTVSEKTLFWVQAIDGNGCSAGFDTLSLFVQDQNSVFVPSGFSPNNDGLNDFFNVVVLEYSSLELIIYDRWGSEVWSNPNIQSFNGTNESQGWNGQDMGGTDMPLGTYVYVLVINYPDNTTERKQGTVTLVR